jgi:hypothetical protein
VKFFIERQRGVYLRKHFWLWILSQSVSSRKILELDVHDDIMGSIVSLIGLDSSAQQEAHDNFNG